MNTPAHVVLGAFALGRGRFAPHTWPIALGALLPDAPMFAFYVYQRGWDPAHHGDVFMAFEVAALVLASVALWRRGGSWRWLGGGGLASMAAFAAFAISQWSGQGAP